MFRLRGSVILIRQHPVECNTAVSFNLRSNKRSLVVHILSLHLELINHIIFFKRRVRAFNSFYGVFSEYDFLKISIRVIKGWNLFKVNENSKFLKIWFISKSLKYLFPEFVSCNSAAFQHFLSYCSFTKFPLSLFHYLFFKHQQEKNTDCSKVAKWENNSSKKRRNKASVYCH